MYDVLLVDDEPRMLDNLEKHVDWKYCGIRNVFKAQNISKAMELLKERQIDVIVCDIEMPGGTGIALIEWIKDEKVRTNVIFVTCHTEFEIMRRAIQLKCYDYVLKPVNYDELSMIVKELTGKLEAWESGNPNADDVYWGHMSEKMLQIQQEQDKNRDIEQEVRRYLREHLADDVSIQEMADNLHFNPQYLMRTFKAKTGMTVMECLTTVRVDAAKKILKNTRLPVKDVAGMVGYGNFVYFTQVFKKATGATPSQYRSENI